MPNSPQPPLLRALDGGAQTSCGPVGRLVLVGERGGTLQTAAAHLSPPPDLAALPRLQGREALIYTTLAALHDSGLGLALARLGVRRVVDLRVAPAFGALGLRRRAFVQLLAEHGASYLHLEALANPYVSDSWHAENYRQRLRRYYRERPRPLALLRRILGDGPVMVLAAERSAIEFELLVRALERVERGVEAHTLPPGAR